MSYIYRNTGPMLKVHQYQHYFNISVPNPEIGAIYPGEQYVSHTYGLENENYGDGTGGKKRLKISFRDRTGNFRVGYLDTGADGQMFNYQLSMRRYAISSVTLDGLRYTKYNLTRETSWRNGSGVLMGYLHPDRYSAILCRWVDNVGEDGARTGDSYKNTIRTSLVYDKWQGKYVSLGGLIYVDMQWGVSSMPSTQTVRSRA